jgi:hypothetical protein
MTPSLLLPALLIAAAIPARAQKALTPTSTTPTITCDGPAGKKNDIKAENICKDIEGAIKGTWANDKCLPTTWDYMIFTCSVGKEDALCNTVEVVEAKGSSTLEKVKTAWNKNAAAFDRRYFLQNGQMRYLKDLQSAAKMVSSYSDVLDACKALQSDAGNVDKLKAMQDKKTAFDGDFKTFTDKDNDVDQAASPDLRLANIFQSDSNSFAKQFRDAVDAWGKSVADSAAAKAQAAQAAAAQAQKGADQKMATIQDYRQKLNKWSPNDPENVSREMRVAFDQAGLKGVKVGDATKGADGTIMMDIAISQEDYDKLGADQKTKLTSMGIHPPPPGMKMMPFAFPSQGQQARIDYFEKTLFSTDAKTQLKVEATGTAISDAGYRQWAQSALGSGIGNLAGSPHGEAAVQDKVNAARSKAAADYADANADLLKKCQDKHDQIVKLGGDPAPADQKCAQDRGAALMTYHERLDAVADAQSHADQLSAAANTVRIRGYGDVLARKKKEDADLFGNVGVMSYWTDRPRSMSPGDVPDQLKKADAAYKILFKEIVREDNLVTAALAKMPDVQTGSAPMSTVRSLDSDFFGKVLNEDRPSDAFDNILGKMQKAFDKAMLR